MLFYFDLATLILIFIELIVRYWAATALPIYKGWWGALRLAFNPWYWLDIAVIAITITCMIYDMKFDTLSVLLRGFRMIHFFEIR